MVYKLYLKQDYFDVIKNPMCLQTIGEKLQNNQYESVDECCDDFQLMIDNCCKYNGVCSVVSKFY